MTFLQMYLNRLQAFPGQLSTNEQSCYKSRDKSDVEQHSVLILTTCPEIQYEKNFHIAIKYSKKNTSFDTTFPLWSKFHSKHIKQVLNRYLLNLTIAWSLIIWYLFKICDVSVVDLLIGLFVARSSAFARTDSIIGS